MISSNQTSAISAADLPPPSQQKRPAWPFAATLLCASLLGIALAFCVRTALPAFALDGDLFSSSVVCSSANSEASLQATRTAD